MTFVSKKLIILSFGLSFIFLDTWCFIKPVAVNKPAKISRLHGFSDLLSSTAENREMRSKVMLITIPKSGTHLLEKCLYLLDKRNYPYDYNEELPFEHRWAVNKNRNHTPPNHWKGNLYRGNLTGAIEAVRRTCVLNSKHYKSHIYYAPDYNNILDAYRFKKILLLRDPRAVLVSFANMVKEGFEPDHQIDFEDLLLDLIDGRQQHYIPWASSRHPVYPYVWEIGMCNFYALYLPFMQTKNCLTVQFENLVGAKGGGSDELQVNEVKKIVDHLGIKLSVEKMKILMHDLFGDSATFHQGTIDGWKKYFTPVIKEAFKKVKGANEFLVALGYEKKLDW